MCYSDADNDGFQVLRVSMFWMCAMTGEKSLVDKPYSSFFPLFCGACGVGTAGSIDGSDRIGVMQSIAAKRWPSALASIEFTDA